MDLMTVIRQLIASRNETAASALDAPTAPQWHYHAATQERRAWRAVKRRRGFRQARLERKAARRAAKAAES